MLYEFAERGFAREWAVRGADDVVGVGEEAGEVSGGVRCDVEDVPD